MSLGPIDFVSGSFQSDPFKQAGNQPFTPLPLFPPMRLYNSVMSNTKEAGGFHRDGGFRKIRDPSYSTLNSGILIIRTPK